VALEQLAAVVSVLARFVDESFVDDGTVKR